MRRTQQQWICTTVATTTRRVATTTRRVAAVTYEEVADSVEISQVLA